MKRYKIPWKINYFGQHFMTELSKWISVNFLTIKIWKKRCMSKNKPILQISFHYCHLPPHHRHPPPLTTNFVVLPTAIIPQVISKLPKVTSTASSLQLPQVTFKLPKVTTPAYVKVLCVPEKPNFWPPQPKDYNYHRWPTTYHGWLPQPQVYNNHKTVTLKLPQVTSTTPQLQLHIVTPAASSLQLPQATSKLPQ